MLNIKLLRENIELVKQNIAKKQENEKLVLVDDILELDEQWRKLVYEIDQLKGQRNKLSEEINKAKKEKKDIKPIVEKAKEIPKKIVEVEDRANKLKQKINSKLSKLPNIMHPDVPIGKDDSENPEIRKWGEIKEKDFEILNHVELCEKNNWANFEASAETSGNGFYYLMGDLALLNQALIRFAIEFMQERSYTYVEGPLMLRKKVLAAAMDVEEFKDSIYKIDGEDLNLIGTSEHSILGYLTNAVIKEEDLPLKLFSYSACFRKEIGSHGINEKGLWRTHQFNKVEQFIFTSPEKTWEAYDELMTNTEKILQELVIPHRVIEMCTADLALWKSRSHDVEVYRPTTKEYGETMSLSNCTDFQARDLNIKLLKKSGEREILHTLNNTALATSRIMVAILENYQNKDGTVTIPKALRKYMFNKELMKANKKLF
jgi:seryl-tRNA synthetase